MLKLLGALLVIFLLWRYFSITIQYDGRTAEEWYNLYDQAFAEKQSSQICVEENIQSLKEQYVVEWAKVSEFALNARSSGVPSDDIEAFVQQKEQTAQQNFERSLKAVLLECF